MAAVYVVATDPSSILELDMAVDPEHSPGRATIPDAENSHI